MHNYREENISTCRKIIKRLLGYVEGYFYKPAEKCYILNMAQIQVLEFNCQCYTVLRVAAFRRWPNKERRILINETSTSIQGLKIDNSISFVSLPYVMEDTISILSGKGSHKQLSWNKSSPKKTMNLLVTLDCYTFNYCLWVALSIKFGYSTTKAVKYEAKNRAIL